MARKVGARLTGLCVLGLASRWPARSFVGDQVRFRLKHEHLCPTICVLQFVPCNLFAFFNAPVVSAPLLATPHTPVLLCPTYFHALTHALTHALIHTDWVPCPLIRATFLPETAPHCPALLNNCLSLSLKSAAVLLDVFFVLLDIFFVLLGILFVLLDLALHSTPHVTAQPLFTCRCLNAAACAGVPSSLCSTLSSLCSTL